ncbi:hypothetical protein ACKWTF_001240 [Chironomus riparius]
MLKFVLITISIGIASCAIQNYCKTDKCDLESYRHITCDFKDSATFKKGCNAGARIIEFTDDIKQKWVDAHNKYRNKIASGGSPGFNTAANMATMEWDDTLAEYAILNVFRCKIEHDCHNTDDMKHAGQNIFQGYDEDMGANSEVAVNAWYGEISVSTQSDIDNCCDYLRNGHFTQVVRDKANRVGCAGGKFKYQGNDIVYVVCNYSFGNYPSKAYISGPPASKCKTGNNPNYPALCSSAEQIDPNNVD